MKRFIASFSAKLLAKLLRGLRFSGGTALPGLLGERFFPSLLSELAERFSKGTILITGTNGKTTTARLITNILKTKGYKVVHNYTGSNLTRGILGQILLETGFWGNFQADFGVFEVDEATMEKAASALKPRIILVTNLFRDQLDRYGELDKVASIIKSSLKLASEFVILNGDDPLVSSLANEVNISKLFYGINETSISLPKSVVDLNHCPLCDEELHFNSRLYGHLGDYNCPRCGFKRPEPDIFAYEIQFNPDFSISFKVDIKGKVREVHFPLYGIFNVYNFLASLSLCVALGFDISSSLAIISQATPAFGRLEKFKVDSKECILLLAKNPVGFSINIDTLKRDKRKKNFLLILNDNLADGTDTSWIWDVDFESLNEENFRFAVCAGIRAEDIALRLKYAGIPPSKLEVINPIGKAFEKAISLMDKGEVLYILPNYTAMLNIRAYLAKEGILKDFWMMK
ncbi:MAG: MurT ligase domain-containing protein [bacterium]